MNLYNLKNQKEGAALLIIVVLLSASSLLVALMVWFLGIGELEMGYDSSKSLEVFSVADGCMDETLRRIKINSNYGVVGGTIILTLGSSTCEVTVNATGNDRTITTKGIKDNYNKKIEVNLTLSGNDITINSWNEISN